MMVEWWSGGVAGLTSYCLAADAQHILTPPVIHTNYSVCRAPPTPYTILYYYTKSHRQISYHPIP